ncbi:MAG: hypothetical protein WAU42_14785 [Solirubrobacteraceae bacterium]
MIKSASHDYELTYGSDWQETMVLYSDERCKRWRGIFNEEWEYLPGDVVQAEDDTAWVCTKRVQFTGPLTIGQSQWSPLAKFNATGYTIQIVCDAEGGWAGFTVTPEVEPTEGKVNVAVPHADFAGAPSSAHWYLKITEPGGAVMEPPISGTLLFKRP